MGRPLIGDVLAERAHPDLVHIWSAESQVRYERELWTKVMFWQQALGVDIPDSALEASRNVCRVAPGTLERIQAREQRTKHDLKARLEIFCEDAGHQYHHLGMTSADVVENIYLIRMRDSLEWLNGRHHQILLHQLARWVPFRGIKGPLGTQQDQIELLGSIGAARELDRRLADSYGFEILLECVPQVTHRSVDLQIATELHSALIRSEVEPKPEIPILLMGFISMVTGYQGQTWQEGDVSTSVVRRVALPAIFYCADLYLRPGHNG